MSRMKFHAMHFLLVRSCVRSVMGNLAEEKVIQHTAIFEKNHKQNGEINANGKVSRLKSEVKESVKSKIESNMVSPKAKLRFQKMTAKQAAKGFDVLNIVAFIWFSAECIVSYGAILAVVIALSPLIVTYNVLKAVELVFAFVTRGARSVSGQDALWQQDTDKNRLIITSVLVVPAPKNNSLDKELENFRRIIIERMVHAKNERGELIYPRVRWCIRPGYFQYFFEEEENFQIEKHVFKWEGDVPNSKEELEEVVSKLSGDAIPKDLSPWYYCCIPTNYGKKDLAVVFRAHHSMADGVSLVRFLVSKLPDHKIPEKEPTKFSSKGRVLMFAKAVLIMARLFFKLILMPGNKSVLHGPEPSGVKKVSWSNAMDLELIKRIKYATGSTVNDVLMTCLSIAVRGYYRRRGVQSPPDFEACIPVDVRPSKRELSFKNRFAVVFLNLPSSVDGALAQLMETKARMDIIKTSGEPISMAWLTQISVAFCPEIISKPLLGFVCNKSSCVLSNVPGPQAPIQIAENEVKHMTFWPPQRNHIGIGLSIFTYAGKVFVAAQGDVAIMSDPHVLLEEYSSAVEELSNAVLTPDEMNGRT